MDLTRNNLSKKRKVFLEDQETLTKYVEETVTFPEQLANWMGRLKLLYGIPINYLIPDERMLPPESIRFFYLDDNWINALVDGAFSIGRNLTYTEQLNQDMAQDKATNPLVNGGANNASSAIRANNLGIDAKVSVHFQTISGFILRSSVVKDYPGLGVNPYPKGGTPDKNPKKVQLLNILRMEHLGPNTLICLVDGDIEQIDIHEAPESLHYGLDSFGIEESKKNIYRFKKNPDKPTEIIMDKNNPIPLNLSKSKCFRKNSPRTLKMNQLSKLIGTKQKPKIDKLDSSEMGFEMIVGVGMVSFRRKNKKR